MEQKQSVTSLVKEIKRRTRRLFSSEEKIKIVLEGLRRGGCIIIVDKRL